jgi:prepilin-type N-terminal cleavage/methylation domain-containing protein
MKINKQSGFTLIELLVVISIIAIIAAAAMPAFTSIMLKGRMSDQLNNGRQIYLAMRSYASETANGGSFPSYRDPEDANTKVNSSNEAGEILLKGAYLDDKKVFFNKNSAWCKVTTKSESTDKRIQQGECDWAYVRGLRDNSSSRWPILANAFASAQATYNTDPSQKGGVWKGTKAVVIFAGGSAEIVNTKEQGTSYFVGRPDKPSSNAFQKDSEWLNGEDIEVLQPQG